MEFNNSYDSGLSKVPSSCKTETDSSAQSAQLKITIMALPNGNVPSLGCMGLLHLGQGLTIWLFRCSRAWLRLSSSLQDIKSKRAGLAPPLHKKYNYYFNLSCNRKNLCPFFYQGGRLLQVYVKVGMGGSGLGLSRVGRLQVRLVKHQGRQNLLILKDPLGD